MARQDVTPDLPSHTPGTPRGEERVRREGPEPGRESKKTGRASRDSTSINASSRAPIDSRMPNLPPA
jgi:hypothetical protein